MNKDLFDLYSDYLLSSMSATTATGLSALLPEEVSHDQVTRLLSSKRMDSKAWWQIIKPQVRAIQTETGVINVCQQKR